MNEAVVLLVLLWAALLVPQALRARNASPHATVGGFARAMDVLRSGARRPAGTRRVLVPADASRIVARPVSDHGPESRLTARRATDALAARRLLWFVRCLVASGVTLIVGLVVGGWMWLPFVLSAGCTLVYVALLRHLKLQRDEARAVVRDLDLHVEVLEGAGSFEAGADGWADSGTVRLRRWAE